MSAALRQVLKSAARLQSVVPDAVLVGGSAAALHAGHRDSSDHDHVLADLVDRYEAVLGAVEATQDWATSVRASKPPFTIMGSLDGIEAGLRQMRRTRPLETVEVAVGDGAVVVVPTEAEALRVKDQHLPERKSHALSGAAHSHRAHRELTVTTHHALEPHKTPTLSLGVLQLGGSVRLRCSGAGPGRQRIVLTATAARATTAPCGDVHGSARSLRSAGCCLPMPHSSVVLQRPDVLNGDGPVEAHGRPSSLA